jgi:hypothetical protein
MITILFYFSIKNLMILKQTVRISPFRRSITGKSVLFWLAIEILFLEEVKALI